MRANVADSMHRFCIVLFCRVNLLIEGAFVSEGLHQDAVRDEPVGADSLGVSAAAQHMGTFRYLFDGRRWVWSEAAAQMHGYQREDVQPSLEMLLQHTHFEDRARMVAELRRVVLGQPLCSRYRIVDNAGNLLWIAIVAEQLKDESGAILGAAGYFVDVTEAVRAGVTAAVSDIAKSRGVIEQAKGVLIAAYGISADEAFAILVQRSQDSNIKVKDVAGQLVAELSEGSAKLRTRVDDVLRTVERKADSS
jgi:PAS domain S-box-containing protein